MKFADLWELIADNTYIVVNTAVLDDDSKHVTETMEFSGQAMDFPYRLRDLMEWEVAGIRYDTGLVIMLDLDLAEGD